jgi:hypothetical protein
MKKSIVSPFEYAIAQIADPEAAASMRSETEREKELRLTGEFKDFFSRITIRNDVNDIDVANPEILNPPCWGHCESCEKSD